MFINFEGIRLLLIINYLMDIFIRMLDMDLPQSVHHAVGDTLLTGAPVLLPPLQDKLCLLLEMLKNVKCLSKGQVSKH